MAIETVKLTQQQNYYQSHQQKRQLTVIQPDKKTVSIEETSLTLISDLVSINNENLNNNTNHLDNSGESFQHSLSTKVQLMVLVLENFFGRKINISTVDAESSNNALSIKNEGSTVNNGQNNDEQVTIDQQNFNRNDLLQVEQWHSHKQQLSYQMQGEFSIDNKKLSIDYSFTLESEQLSYSRFEMTAGALKDPLLVQFGQKSMGNITGEHNFAINEDNTLDKLPIFSGDVGYLVFDKNNNQQADNGSELFGPKTGQGFNELAQLDSNGNGFIDEGDMHFDQLAIWQPSDHLNSPANSESTQWLSLKEAGIEAINLSSIATPYNFYNQSGETQAQLTRSGFAINSDGQAMGVHQIDVKI
ncbi:MAG: hypothetical protein OCD00_13025 [Colwellia sp.]